MTSLSDRETVLKLAAEARAAGAGEEAAARELGLSARTLRRWRARRGKADARPEAGRPAPNNALSGEERQKVVNTCNEARFASSPPGHIVPVLAEEGTYLASESTFYRVLRARDRNHRRGRARAPNTPAPPRTRHATGPGQVWVWDITWLPTRVIGLFFKLQIIMDLFSRKIVAWEVWEAENAANSEELLRRAALAENIAAGNQPVLHGDNGSPLKAGTVLALMYKLGITPSHGRPRVSNDNAHAEAFFRTAKYHPSLDPGGFATIEAARRWAADFVNWYNHEHRHAKIGFVTPCQKHEGRDHEILEQRRETYRQAKARNPGRWINGRTRPWNSVNITTLNPVQDRQIEKILKAN